MIDKKKPQIVVLTGAGISAESGIKTFRDSDGLWEGYKIEEVATPEAWNEDFIRVLNFYNERRENVKMAKPNGAHFDLVSLESEFEVRIITQNVDDLHERAGSSTILHLHGEINKSRSTSNPNLVYNIVGSQLNPGDKCDLGSQLRPHIVWFGEEVPNIVIASDWVSNADILVVIGTSLQVYPAAGLCRYLPLNKPIITIDPKPLPFIRRNEVFHIQKTAVEGVKDLWPLLEKFHI
ncbi:MAG: NAD-dependent deacylase [Bacteroidia bacterium]|nr:NAD-dependent deacylase [Bacteroidia bacterium]MCF8425445.1 NAD-dependent deacylase [Bacteroidia bacterium]MCF8446273.1 NAD-dependent deacylase [Bacteroidia bacterium]